MYSSLSFKRAACAAMVGAACATKSLGMKSKKPCLETPDGGESESCGRVLGWRCSHAPR